MRGRLGREIGGRMQTLYCWLEWGGGGDGACGAVEPKPHCCALPPSAATRAVALCSSLFCRFGMRSWWWYSGCAWLARGRAIDVPRWRLKSAARAGKRQLVCRLAFCRQPSVSAQVFALWNTVSALGGALSTLLTWGLWAGCAPYQYQYQRGYVLVCAYAPCTIRNHI